ncbi:type IV pilin protein [Rheinheimera gaetbuli]
MITFNKALNIKGAGFSLIEVMIVVVIVGILASIAVPSYQRYVITSNRTTATACLTELAQFMERTYTQNMRYNPNGFVLPQLQCRTDLAQRYGFALSNHNIRTYTLSAQPTSIQNDTECGTLTLNQAGQKGAAGGFNANTVRNCW